MMKRKVTLLEDFAVYKKGEHIEVLSTIAARLINRKVAKYYVKPKVKPKD